MKTAGNTGGLKLYVPIDVWERTGDGAVRYRCFQVLPGGRYCVQSADFHSAETSEANARWLDRQHAELFREQAPDERAGTFASLEEAIAAHKRCFSGH